MNKKQITKIVLTSLITLSLISISTSSFSATDKMEKCSGIVKKGMADGQALVDGEKVDWILVPAGACEKFVDGVIIFDEK